MAGLEQMDEVDVSFTILVVDSRVMSIVVLVHLNVVCEHGFVSGVRAGLLFFFNRCRVVITLRTDSVPRFSIMISLSSSPISSL